MRKKEFYAKAIQAVLALGMVVGGTLSAVSQVLAISIVYRNLDSTIEKTFGADSFDADYSKGILYRASSVKINNTDAPLAVSFSGTSTCPDDATHFCGKNTVKDPNTYMKVTRGAIYNNEYLDVVEYNWVDEIGVWSHPNTADNANVIWWNPRPAEEIEGDTSNMERTVHREFHFYKTGTNTEVSFRGVMAFSDFDSAEGYQVLQGYHQAYLDNPTILDYIAPNTWLTQGTEIAVSDSIMLHLEVEGSSSRPLTLLYKVPQGRASDTVVTNVKHVTYQLTGTVPGGTTAPGMETVMQYGTLNLATAKTVNGYTFSGWYLNQAMTNPASLTIRVTEDTMLYGQYIKDDAVGVQTSVVNGEITAPNVDMTAGSDFKAEYSCANGKKPVSVTIDGVDADISKYTDSFTFENVDSLHTIVVVCEAVVAPEEGKDNEEKSVTVPDTGSLSMTDFGDGGLGSGESRNINVVLIVLSSAASFIGLAMLVHLSSRRHMMKFN